MPHQLPQLNASHQKNIDTLSRKFKIQYMKHNKTLRKAALQ